ncbi:TetR family transcriptional regulator [Mycobacterium aquaticum]|uniref:TetR family transcriptional regulator n=1 Tax=Mycobacterium aquaticum TaxID=1927124 RepID=A0A1X0AS00_9MYCO|nr:TetR family transcriptional regulator [Mycobacterium aquaticum]
MAPDRRPRRGAPRKGEPGARERILAAASRLFYQEGIRAVGVDTVIAESGVAKASFYRTFQSKDALIEAFVTERDRLFWLWWDNTVDERSDDPLAMLDALLAGVARQIEHPDYRGCPFLNTATEFPDNTHPGRIVARANKDELRRRLTELCTRVGVANPEHVGAQLFLLINGAYAAGQMASDSDLSSTLVSAAHNLISPPSTSVAPSQQRRKAPPRSKG